MKLTRQENALKRLEAQLKTGVKPFSRKNDEFSDKDVIFDNYGLPEGLKLTEKDKSRIESEITSLKKKLKIITVFFGLLICTLPKQGWTQANISVSSGYSFGKAMVAGFDFGYNRQFINVRGGMITHLSNKVNEGTVIFVKAGHTFNISDRLYFSGSVGYSYIYRDADHKGNNKNSVLWNGEGGYKYQFKEQAMALFTGYTQVEDNKIIQIGLRGFF